MDAGLNPTQEKAIFTLCINSGKAICEVLAIVFHNQEQIELMNLETFICGLSMMRLFLVHSGKATKGDAIITHIEEAAFATAKPRGIRTLMLRFRRLDDYALNRYQERRERYFDLFRACIDYSVDDDERFWQRKINAPGSALFQEILLNVVRCTPIRSFAGDSDAKTLKSNELRLPTETQLIKASYYIHDAVMFSYNFFNENWEGLVIRR
jgi:hypothetical protein